MMDMSHKLSERNRIRFCKSQLMHFSFRPDVCPFQISTPPVQWLQLIALESSMDLWFRKNGGSRLALMSEISREKIIKIHFKSQIFSYHVSTTWNTDREEISLLYSYFIVHVACYRCNAIFIYMLYICNVYLHIKYSTKRQNIRSLVEFTFKGITV